MNSHGSMNMHRFQLKVLHQLLDLRKSHLVTGLAKAFSLLSMNATATLLDELVRSLGQKNFPTFP